MGEESWLTSEPESLPIMEKQIDGFLQSDLIEFLK
jgi:hypothetical protein